MIARIVAAFCLGVLLALARLADEPFVRKLLTAYVTQIYETSFQCRFAGNCTQVDLLSLSFTIEDFSVAPTDDADWSWRGTRYTTSFSLWHFLRTRALGMSIYLEDVRARSAAHGTSLAIAPHLSLLASGMSADLLFVLTNLFIVRAAVDIVDGESKMAIHTDALCRVHVGDRVTTLTATLSDGSVHVGSMYLLEHAQGSVLWHVPNDGSTQAATLVSDLVFQAPALPVDNNTCFFHGTMTGNSASCTCSTTDRATFSALCAYTGTANGPYLDFQVSAPLASIARVCGAQMLADALSGNAEVRGVYGFCTSTPFKLMVQAHDVQLYHVPLCSRARIDACLDGHEWQAQGMVEGPVYGYLDGTGSWNATNATGAAELCNKIDVACPGMPDWRIPAQAGHLACAVKEGRVDGSYHIGAVHAKTDTRIQSDGTFACDQYVCKSSGSLGNCTYRFDGNWRSFGVLRQFLCTRDDGQVMLQARACDARGYRWKAELHADVLKKCMAQLCAYQLEGDGCFQLQGERTVDGFLLKVAMRDGALRLVETYNVLRAFQAYAKLSEGQLRVHRLRAIVDEGTVSCTDALVQWQDLTPQFVYVPVVFDRCLLMLSKDFLSQVAGSFVYSYEHGQSPHLAGSVFFDRALIKENIFSGALREQLTRLMRETYLPTYDMCWQIDCATRVPMRVKTSFLEAQVQAQVQIDGSMHEPCVTGEIELIKGLLNFPYRPLYITKGHVHFIPHQLYDPAIELVAQARVKKYGVTLGVRGSLQQHDIHLHASPPLGEEQIVALLLIGSDEASLSRVAPALLTSNLATLIFGAARGSTSLERYFSAMLAPFKYVRFIPSFSDQSGRGGLRGGIEIECADRWRALIQKNFSLSEDTRFELEYQVSDDISLKAIRDEHRDVSAEMEMRWKF